MWFKNLRNSNLILWDDRLIAMNRSAGSDYMMLDVRFHGFGYTLYM